MQFTKLLIKLCQIFFLNDIARIEEELSSQFPYSYTSIDDQITVREINRAPCSGIKTYSGLFCLMVACDPQGPHYKFIVCATIRCGIFSNFSQNCISCLGAAIPGNINPLRRCVFFSASAVNAHGVMVLSKRPMTNAVTIPFLPNRRQLNSKAMIVSEVEGIGTVVCAHLSADISDEYAELDSIDLFSTYEEENLSEAQLIVDTFKHHQNIVLMGDFNTGPSVPFNNVVAKFPDSYTKYVTAGFISPYVEFVGKHTFLTVNSILDHVMHRGFTALAAERIFINEDGVTLSDHYAVAVWLQ